MFLGIPTNYSDLQGTCPTPFTLAYVLSYRIRPQFSQCVTTWQASYTGISPIVARTDTAQDTEIQKGLSDLKAYVTGIYQKEQGGRRFIPEEAT
jgi:hypothetical protein